MGHTVLFKSPFSNRIHPFQDYDDEDYILNNERTEERITRSDFNNPALTRNGWNRNRFSTRVNQYNDITLGKGQLHTSARKFRKKIFGARKWKNW